MQFDDSNKNTEQATKQFIHLMTTAQMNIYSYIMSIVGNANDADDIMQNTSSYMWEQFSKFRTDTDFVSWGNSIAYYKIKEFRKLKNRQQLSDEAMDIIHKKAQNNLSDVNIYIENLNKCLSKLPAFDLSIIKLHYESGHSVKQISARINKTVQAVYLRLSKIQGILSRCIKRSIKQESI